MSPKRIQMSRAKGWRLPENAVVVARPSRWGNPYVVGTGEIQAMGPMWGPGAGRYNKDDERWYNLPLPGHRGLTADLAVALYREDLVAALAGEYDRETADELREALGDLTGKDLACWCPLEDEQGHPVPCHADVLLALANVSEPVT